MVSRLVRAVASAAVAALLVAALTGCMSGSGSAAAGGSASSGDASVQSFSVDLSSGSYQPNEITAKAGTPVRITFGQGQGCVQRIVFPAFNIAADLGQGPKTFDLGVLQPGDYQWSCGMNMQHGVLHVK